MYVLKPIRYTRNNARCDPKGELQTDKEKPLAPAQLNRAFRLRQGSDSCDEESDSKTLHRDQL